jgi:hypothetical protein
MALTPLEIFQFAGVDSRSNPLNCVPGKSLRCRNFVPKESGMLELRYGFSTVSMSGSTSTAAYHSLLPYTLYDNSGNETPYLLLGQGTQLRAMNIATGAVSSPTIKGAALAGTASFQSYLFNGKIHFGNGTEQKWFDGTTVRDNGLRALTAAEIANVQVGFGVDSLSAANNSSVTLTPAGGGSLSATSGSGILFYVSKFDSASNELGPAPLNAGSGRVTLTLNQKVTVAGLPDLSVIAGEASWYKLISRTGDGTAAAYFCTNTSTAVVSCSRSGTTLTVISTAHGLSSNDIVVLSGTTNFDGIYFITKIDNNTFTAALNQASGQNVTGSNTTGGTCKRIVSATPAGTTVDVLAPTQDTNILANDANRGLAVSASGLSTPGYAFYLAIYNPTADGHVGNRIALNVGRFTTISPRDNVRITGLPDLSGTDSEWTILIGRTGDGAQIPYPCADSNGNWFHTVSGQTAITLTTQGALDGVNEMPTRNGIIPSGLNMFALSGGKVYGAIAGRPTVYFSADEADDLNGDFIGRPEQSWAPNDIETFPTAQGLRGMFDEDRGVFCATKNDGAILADLGSTRAWIGPWYGAGIAGQRAHCDTPFGKFWLSGHKQLLTFEDGTPTAVSDEYQAALLSKIGDAYLSQTEMVHLTDIAKGINKIVIKCLDTNGIPFEVHHDFKLRDGNSPTGQAYESLYSAPLATNYIVSRVRDSADAERVWAGGSNGSIYQLESGANDAGSEFSADAIYPLNAGPNRPSVPEFRIFGDTAAVLSIAARLDASPSSTASSSFVPLVRSAVPGEDGNSYSSYKRTDGTKLNKGFLRIQLDSHSVDGDLSFNDPPHVPLETYGRIYLGMGLIGQQQGI